MNSWVDVDSGRDDRYEVQHVSLPIYIAMDKYPLRDPLTLKVSVSISGVLWLAENDVEANQNASD